ncbi:Retrotransposon protein [Phytophthora palmivora]|uniref:Retrotransposon protein n=1 Tax=Phytophthora palmivora TaxID=4796 RepID=A0A2P4XUR5_9STRA|nr:Retrotransposon protein [Phytophthora palmivora]
MTLHEVKEMAFWRTIPADIDEFVRGCIHLSFNGLPYVLALNEGMSGYTELASCPAASADEALTALVDCLTFWNCASMGVRPGHPLQEHADRLPRVFGAQLHFVTAGQTNRSKSRRLAKLKYDLQTGRACFLYRTLRYHDTPHVPPKILSRFTTRCDGRSTGARPSLCRWSPRRTRCSAVDRDQKTTSSRCSGSASTHLKRLGKPARIIFKDIPELVESYVAARPNRQPTKFM